MKKKYCINYMGYKQKMRKIKQAQINKNLRIMQEANDKRLLDEWVIVKNDPIKPVGCISV